MGELAGPALPAASKPAEARRWLSAAAWSGWPLPLAPSYDIATWDRPRRFLLRNLEALFLPLLLIALKGPDLLGAFVPQLDTPLVQTAVLAGGILLGGGGYLILKHRRGGALVIDPLRQELRRERLSGDGGTAVVDTWPFSEITAVRQTGGVLSAGVRIGVPGRTLSLRVHRSATAELTASLRAATGLGNSTH